MNHIKKIELHTHLEGTASPKIITALAQRNHIPVPHHLISDDGEHFIWDNFNEFLDAYEHASMVIKHPIDYYDITYDYLATCAASNTVYVEMMYSPCHAERATGIPSKEHLAAIAEAIDDAWKKHQITGRIITTAVRHYGIEACEKVAKEALDNPHPYVVGFSLGGDEVNFPPQLFKRTYAIAKEAGLGLSTHAGEMDGPRRIIEALDNLSVTRLGHGVRAIEDKEVLQRLIDDNIHLEICPTSNIALKVFPSYNEHPLRKLYDLGVHLSLNADDPPYFNCSIASEYELAQTQFGFSDDELNQVTLMALDAAFIDKDLKSKIKKQLES